MQVDDPPYLSVGTAVSAKYKGAFCEARVSKVVRVVKCKVTYKMGLGNATVTDEHIKGTLRVGQMVQAKHPEKKELVDATITKIQDCSQYTVVFDDGDITTLKRTALCLKSGRHFNESETLDQLPLTHPEHFGNPVVGGRRGRRNRQLKEDSSDGENEEENEPDLEGYTVDIGRVVSVELSEKKRSKDNWFPGLIVIPSAQPTVRINVKDEFLVRSFKDGRYYTVPKKEVSEFNKELSEKVDGSNLAEAIQKALKYLDSNELPVHWERSSLFNSQNLESDSEENVTDSSDDEPCEEKDRFVAQLYKFMDEAGTPLNKTPTVNSKDVDLHRLFRVVQKLGGYNRVTNQNKWRSVTIRLHLPSIQNTFNQVKSIYKKCLFSYESFHRTLGVTMLNHTRSTKKNRGRSLIRDKDRATPVNSPKPDKEEEPVEKKEEPKEQPSQPVPEVKPKRKLDLKKDDDKKKKDVGEVSDANSNSEVVETFDSVPGPSKEPGRPKRIDNKTIKDKKIKAATGEKVKALVEKFEEQSKKEDEDKTQQQTRSKSQNIIKQKETVPPPTLPPVEKKVEAKVHPPRDLTPSKTAIAKPTKKTSDDEKKRGRKRTITEDKSTSDSSTSESAPSLPTPIPSVSTAVTIPLNATSSVANSNINIGAKLKVYYGPTHESKVTYEAKILEVDKDSAGNTMYLVHYTGWNTRYDEWIPPTRIAENLSATTKAKRLKRGAAAAAAASAAASASKTSTSVKVPTKRGRGISITGKNTAPAEIPRSTTPSSVTSTGSRTKSPATPATRSTSRLTAKQDISRRSRRTSVQTDASNHSESDSDVSESEAELTRTRSGVKTDEPEVKTYKRKTNKPPAQTTAPKTEKSKDKDDIDSEKEEDSDRPIKRTKKLKKSPEKSTEESDDDTNPPKGRDFDLNQIRSELKGFNKALKVPPLDSADKDAISSSDDSTVPLPEKTAPEEPDEKKDKVLEKSSSSEDIYEFKEPEPFEFETRTKLTDEKNAKKRLVPRIFEDLEKSPSKKKLINSPSKLDQPVIDIPELPEKKRFRRPPLRKQEDSDDEDELPSQPPKKDEDPFDKLVESPSFNLVKTNANNEKLIDAKQRDINSILDEPLNLFRELPETEEDYVRDLGLSDCESQSQHIFSRPGELFSDTFSKSSPDHSALDLEFPLKPDETKLKDSDDEDLIREQIERVIQQSSSTDDDSTDLLITPPTTSYQMKKREEPKLLIPKPEVNVVVEEKSPIVEPVRSPEPVKKEDPIVDSQPSCSAVKHISPALQETDSSLLEAICSQPVLLTSKLDDAKDLNVKTGTKIADSILQKFNSIKNKIEGKSSRGEIESNAKKTDSSKVEVKQEPVISEEAKVDIKTENEPLVKHPEEEEKITVPEPQKLKLDIPTSKYSNANENRRRKKAISRAYIETDSDSSDDSEQLVIARSDEDSQTTSLGPKDNKESDSNLSAQIPSTDDSQPQQEEQRNFKFEDIKKESSPAPEIETVKPDPEPVKEEEPDSQLHTLLLCEETLPRSPAPVPESSNIVEQKPAKAILEMPFASAPSTSNTKMILLEHQHKTVAKIQPQQQPQQHIPPQQLAAPINIPLDRDNRPGDAAAVLDNTPPTTPESSISNLSPRGENGDLSPNTVDNESCKSNEPENEYSGARRNSSNKVSPYSEEDTQMTIGETSAINKKVREEPTPSLRKRRKSFRGPDEIPAKRGRKPLNRSRHNSDSDDTSDHSNTGSTNIGLYDRSQRSPRPSRYNFFVEFDPSLDSSQRIAVLQQKLSELRKTYADVKAELAAVERRRKKIKRREREDIRLLLQISSSTF